MKVAHEHNDSHRESKLYIGYSKSENQISDLIIFFFSFYK